MGNIVFTDHQGTGCILIDTVNYDGPYNAVDIGKLSAAMSQERIDQRAFMMACRRMDDHALGLVYDQKIGILIYDIKRYVLRNVVTVLGLGESNFDSVSVFKDHAGLGRNLPVDSYHASGYEPLIERP